MSRINDMTLLSTQDKYLIDGYPYSYYTSEDRSGGTKLYWFKPVSGHGRRTEFKKLSRNQVIAKVERIDAT